MADASPKSASDPQPYLKASFKISKISYDVSLSNTTLSWDKTGGDNSKPGIVKPVLSDHAKQDIFWLFRQVDAYCCMKVVQKAGAVCATFIHDKHPPVYSDFHVI